MRQREQERDLSGLCACGCGTAIPKFTLDSPPKPQIFAKGHNRRKVSCTVRRCSERGVRSLRSPFGTRRFCTQHFPIWREHYLIVDRILAIRPRKRYTPSDG